METEMHRIKLADNAVPSARASVTLIDKQQESGHLPPNSYPSTLTTHQSVSCPPLFQRRIVPLGARYTAKPQISLTVHLPPTTIPAP